MSLDLARTWNMLQSNIYPRPTPSIELNPPAIFARYRQILDNLRSASAISEPVLLEQVRRMWADQEARLASIDGRAGQLMTGAGIAASLVVAAVGRGGVFPTSPTKPALLTSYVIALLYFGRCMIYVLRVHGSRRRSKLGPDELLPDPAMSYERVIANSLLAALVNNYSADNVQVDRLHVAQRCFRNAIIIVAFGGVLALAPFAI